MDRVAERTAHAQAGRGLVGDAELGIGRAGLGNRRVDPGAGLLLCNPRRNREPLGGAVEMTGTIAGNVDDDARALRRRSADRARRRWLRLRLDPQGRQFENRWRSLGRRNILRAHGLRSDGQEQPGQDKDAGTRKRD
ncbi:hypothetical protein LH128_15446 [Sphingomonas sp. LH128]|nr:hypothetical protein LH128_15446 [Sphingomonas sp. LH128]